MIIRKDSFVNTKKQGKARIVIFRSRNSFKAVCLDFDLIEEGETFEEAKNSITDAVFGYIKTVCSNNLDNRLLNRPADKRYWNIYYKKAKITENKGLGESFTMPIKNLCSA